MANDRKLLQITWNHYTDRHVLPHIWQLVEVDFIFLFSKFTCMDSELTLYYFYNLVL